MSIDLMQHQKDTVEALRFHNWVGYIPLLPGYGKTFCILESIKQQQFPLTLIVVPASLKRQWEKEIKSYLNLDPIIIDGDFEIRSLQWSELKKTTPLQGKIVVINYDILVRDIVPLTHMPWGMIALDEAHFIKNPSAKRTKAIKKIALLSRASSRICGSGTPKPNALHEMWAQIDFLSPGILGKNWYEFRNRHCKTHPMFPNKVVGYYNEDYLNEVFNKFIYYVDTSAIKMPELIEKIIYVELTQKERERYNQLRDELILEIEGEETISVPNVVSKILRLRQLLDTPRSIGIPDESSKERALEKIISSRTSKYIIFTEWKTKSDQLAEQFSIPSITGSTKQNDRVRILSQAFSENFLGLVTTSALETGANCQWADSIIHYSLPWNWARYSQRNGRARRKGRTEPVESIVFLVRGTIDEYLWAMIQRKKKLQESLSVEDLKELLQ